MLSNLSNKKCACCCKDKLIKDFYFVKTKGVYHSYCKLCIAKKRQTYKTTESYKICSTKYKAFLKTSGKTKQYNKNARIRRKKRMAEDEQYAERVRLKDRQYRKLPEYQSKRRTANLKRLENPNFRLHNNVARLIRYGLNGNKKGTRTEELLGYSIHTLRKHIEDQFVYPMSWDNYGSYWHIDHIIPRSWPDITFKELWSLNNLRPLEAKLNLLKGDSWEYAPNVFIKCRK
jgi:hypothetical protein